MKFFGLIAPVLLALSAGCAGPTANLVVSDASPALTLRIDSAVRRVGASSRLSYN